MDLDMPNGRFLTRLICLTMFLAVLAAGSGRVALGQPDEKPATPAKPEITQADIDTRSKQAAESTDLPDDTKKRIAEFYSTATGQLRLAGEQKTLAADFEAAADAEKLAERVEQVQKTTTEVSGRTAELPDIKTLAEFQQALAEKDTELVKLRDVQDKAGSKAGFRRGRLVEIRALLPTLETELTKVRKDLEAAAPDDELPLVTEARRTELSTREMLIERQIPALQQELALYLAEEAVDVVRLEQTLAANQVVLAEKEWALLDAKVKELTAKAALKATAQARDEVELARTYPRLESVAVGNQKLAEKSQELTKSLETVDNQLEKIKTRLEDTKKDFENAQQKVDDIGLTGPVGLLLRQNKANLPSLSKHRRELSERQSTIDTVHFQLLTMDDHLRELADLEPPILELLGTASRESADKAEAEAAEYFVTRKREYLNTLVRNYNRYFDRLLELDSTERQLIKTVDEFSTYIDERVLWIRSGQMIGFGDLAEEEGALNRFFQVNDWKALASAFAKDIRSHLYQVGFAFVVFVLLLQFRSRLTGKLEALGATANRASCTRLNVTFQAVLLTAALAVSLPFLPGFIGWRLSLSPTPGVRTVGHALFLASVLIFPLEFFRQACRTSGLASQHLSWPDSSCQKIRTNLQWLLSMGTPVFLIGYIIDEADQQYGILERLLFIFGMLILAVFFRRTLKPLGGVMQEYVAYHQNEWVDRFKLVWYYAGLLLPVVLAVLAFVGFDYTARQLAWRLHSSAWLILGLVLLNALMMRMILLRRRKLSFELARERRKAAATTTGGNVDVDGSANIAPADLLTSEEVTDLEMISTQSRKLLAASIFTALLGGVWLIWSDVLPALKILDNWPVWTVSVTKNIPGMGDVPVNEPVTIGHILLAALLGVLFVVAAKNVPGLLEITLLERLPLDRSIRYAITMLASYVIILLGIIVCFSTLGIGWEKVQWLATALTFGLAFGMQEVFANFVAGLIILFERPLRVGDVVTIDGVSGVVSQIRIRATTIRNWDRQEFIVPNKEFITGKLLNWTLTDQVNRVVITTGVAYGSDAELVRRLILEAAVKNPLIMADPGPSVTFDTFGDSTLNFTLRCYLPNMDNRLSTVNDLHAAIYRLLEENDIEIAFPQQDIHIRSVPRELQLAAPDET
jgi:potassium-dependent mechanosensitive channel